MELMRIDENNLQMIQVNPGTTFIWPMDEAVKDMRRRGITGKHLVRVVSHKTCVLYDYGPENRYVWITDRDLTGDEARDIIGNNDLLLRVEDSDGNSTVISENVGDLNNAVNDAVNDARTRDPEFIHVFTRIGNVSSDLYDGHLLDIDIGLWSGYRYFLCRYEPEGENNQ